MGEKLRAMRALFSLKAKEKMYVAEMEQLLKEFTPDKNWNEFEMYFKRVDNGFFGKLEQRFPDLTPNEKRLCALIRLNLDSKEIAAMTSRTFRSVNTAKTRLKKKLGVGADTSLYVFLSDLALGSGGRCAVGRPQSCIDLAWHPGRCQPKRKYRAGSLVSVVLPSYRMTSFAIRTVRG